MANMERKNMQEAQLLAKLHSTKEPREIRDGLLSLGFNGLFFQRWHPGVIENWEGALPGGFLEHYYGLFLYRGCPTAPKMIALFPSVTGQDKVYVRYCRSTKF